MQEYFVNSFGLLVCNIESCGALQVCRLSLKMCVDKKHKEHWEKGVRLPKYDFSFAAALIYFLKFVPFRYLEEKAPEVENHSMRQCCNQVLAKSKITGTLERGCRTRDKFGIKRQTLNDKREQLHTGRLFRSLTLMCCPQTACKVCMLLKVLQVLWIRRL